MRRFTPALVALLMALGSSFVSADTQPILARGTRDLSLEISPDFEGIVGDMLTLRAGYGHFFRDRFELRLTALYETIEDIAPGERDYRAREIGVAAEYNFGRGPRLVPYLGLELAYRWLHYLEFEGSAVAYGPLGGLKVYLADNVAFDIGLALKMASDDVYVNHFVREDTDLAPRIGFRIVF